MTGRFAMLVALLSLSLPADEPRERRFETVLASLSGGASCWSTVELRNLGDRVVSIEVEAHASSGALVALTDHPQMLVRLKPSEAASYRIDVDAWIKIREIVPSPRFYPVVAVSGTSECVVANQLRTTRRLIDYPLRNPWFSGDVSEIPEGMVAVINTSERAAQVSVCYSAGNLYSVPTAPTLKPVCSHTLEVQIPPFNARQFPVQHEDSSYFSLKTEGEAVVLQMLRPIETGVRVYKVDSTIKFGSEVQ